MSTAETKRTLAHATADAEAFRDLFPRHAYERWEIAGSVRRRQLEISDVEHVIIPLDGNLDLGGLFPETVNLVMHRVDELLAAGKIAQHVYPDGKVRWGPKHRGCRFRDMNHEIFVADKLNWGSVLAIKTGPWQLSKELVTGLLPHGYVNSGGYVRDKHRWACICGWKGPAPYITREQAGDVGKAAWTRKEGQEVAVCPSCGDFRNVDPIIVPCPTEQEFFRMAGLTYVDPDKRAFGGKS